MIKQVITVVAQSAARAVLNRSNIGTVGSSRIQGTGVCIYAVCCVPIAFRWAGPPYCPRKLTKRHSLRS
jgi:hypothetical protein